MPIKPLPWRTGTRTPIMHGGWCVDDIPAIEARIERLRACSSPSLALLNEIDVAERLLVSLYGRVRVQRPLVTVAREIERLDEAEFLLWLGGQPEDRLLGSTGTVHLGVTHRFICWKTGIEPGSLTLTGTHAVLCRGDDIYFARLRAWITHVVRLTTGGEELLPVLACDLRRLLGLPR